MGHYFDWIEQKYIPNSPEPPPGQRRAQYRENTRRGILIEDLFKEIEQAEIPDPISKLYATLLARALVRTHKRLMNHYGKRIAQLSPEQPVRTD